MPVPEFKEALDWLLEEVKNAVTIQRYGVGIYGSPECVVTRVAPRPYKD